LNLPSDVPANEFLTIEGKRLSTSRNWAVWLPDYLERYDPDPLRYALAANMPETGDSDFSWREFIRRNNDELVATYGNLVHRVLSFAYRNFGGQVPSPGDINPKSRELIHNAEKMLDKVDKALYRCSFKEAVREAMFLAQQTNRYLDEQAPWKTIKEDRQAAAMAIFTALASLSALKTAVYPVLPFSSEKLHSFLGFEGNLADKGWTFQMPAEGQKLGEPQPLFTKLDEDIAEQESGRLGSEYKG
jgi:methionyl-tRNA synthetase